MSCAIRPNLLNEIRAGVVILVSASSANFTGDDVLQELGIAGLPARGPINNLPIFSVTGFSSNNINLLNPVNDGHAQVADNLSWVHGRHTMKFGLEHVNFFVNRYMPNTSGIQVFGSFAFTNKFTGNALRGFPARPARHRHPPGTVPRAVQPLPRLVRLRAGRFQNHPQAHPDVRPALGIQRPGLPAERQSLFVRPRHGQNRGAQRRPRRSSSAPTSPPPSRWNTPTRSAPAAPCASADKNNFAPRFGFAYQLDNAGKTVVRGGWGIYYSHYSGNVPGDLSRGPYAATTVFTNNIVNGAAQVTLANPFSLPGTPGTVALVAVTPDLKNSYAQQYTLTLERELTRDIGLRVSYIGSKGTQLAYRRDVNQPAASTVAFSNARRPYPLFSSINYADNGANMLYSGLQTAVQKRFSNGPDVHVHVDLGQGNQRHRRYRRFRTQQHHREQLQPAPRSRQRLLRAAPPVDESGALRTALRQRTTALRLADQCAAQRDIRQLVHAGDQRTGPQQHQHHHAAPRRQRHDFAARTP